MAVIQYTVCDLCLDGAALENPTRLNLAGRAVDVCPAHANVLKNLSKNAPVSEQATAETTTSPRQPKAGSGEKKPRKPRQPRKTTTKADNGEKKTSTSKPLVDMKAVRAWAESNKYPVPKRGPIKKDIVEAFIAADSARVPTAQFSAPE